MPAGDGGLLVHRYRSSELAGPAPLLVLLHGYGSNEDDLFTLAPLIDPHLHVASPRAPHVLGPGSFAWFAIGFTAEGIEVDVEQGRESIDTVRAFIHDLAQRPAIDGGRVYLVGFSQGAMLGAALAISDPDLVAGVVIMSGTVVPDLAVPPQGAEALAGLPILMVHGRRDNVLPIKLGRAGRDMLAALPVDLSYREFDMGHEVTAESFAAVQGWLQERIRQ